MFYGNITNTAKAQFVFDKKYPNRHEMDMQAQYDDVYIGRYVLVEYENDISKDLYFFAYLLEEDGEYKFYSSKNTEETNRLIVNTNSNINVGVKVGDIVCVPGVKDGNVYNLSDPTNKNDEFWVCTGADENGKALFRQLAETNYDESGTPTSLAETQYLMNYSIDKYYYGDGRGFDSTVWEKVYSEDGKETYTKVADLNTISPVLDITAEAPTMNPMTPHFGTDSGNTYYNLHVQPTFGIRVKAADNKLTGPTLNKNGDELTGRVPLSSDEKTYPSDESTLWYRSSYNKDSNKTTKYVLDATKNEAEWLNVEEGFEPGKIPAAIYYNKDGLNSRLTSYSTDNIYENWNNLIGTTAGYVKDQIILAPTGKSGTLYNNHDQSLNETAQEDSMELSIMLPSIGDALAKVWDMIYGDREDNKNNIDDAYKRVALTSETYIQGYYYIKNVDGTYTLSNDEFKSGTVYYEQDKTIVRNRNIDWKNASAVENKEGLRLVNPVTLGAYSYSPGQVDTVAGVINSVHDLMGMIITDELDIDNLSQDEIDKLSDEYIYYDGGKYYRKHKIYDYTAVSPTAALGDGAYKAQTLSNWNNNSQNYFYLDTAKSKAQPEYVKDTEYFSDRVYYKTVNPVNQVTLSDAYEPGIYFTENQENIILDDGTIDGKDLGIKQTYYTPALGEYEVGAGYYKISNVEEVRINDLPIKLYTPGKYYIGTYEPLTAEQIKEINYEKDKYYYVSNYTTSGNNICPIFKKSTGRYDDNQTYFKLDFSLSNSLERKVTGTTYSKQLTKKAILDDGNELPMGTNLYIGYKYYELNATPQEGLSDAYYKEIPNYVDVETYFKNEGLVWDGASSYIANTYYYLDENGVYKLDEDSYDPEVTYYVKTIEYQLIIGTQDVDVNESNTTEVTDRLVNLSQYSEGLYYRRTNLSNNIEYVKVDLNNYANAKNVFWTLSIENFNDPYVKDMYYYVVSSKDSPTGYRVGSYLIDTNNEKTDRRLYYKSVTASEEITTKYYEPDKYYYKSGSNYILATNSYGLDNEGNSLSPIQYYSKEPYYVLSDVNGILSKGAEWNINISTVPSGVTLATRTEKYELQELEGFACTFNTIHGIILRMAELLEQGDTNTRDLKTVQGAINKLNDLIAQIDSMKAGEILIVDEYGKIHSSPYATSEAFSTKNQQASITETNSIAASEDRFIRMDIDANYSNPKITINHNFTSVEDTTTVADKNNALTSATGYSGLGNNNSKGDTLQLYTPIVDNKGHVVGKNTEIVTLPFGYKTFTGDTGSSAATATQSSFTINGDNWLRTEVTEDKLVLIHKDANIATNIKGNTDALSPKFGETFKTLQVGIDGKGHVSSLTEKEITLPKGSLTDADSNGADVITKLSFTDTTGALVTTRTNIGTLKLTGYTAPTDNATTALLATDTINGAFSKVQAHLGNLDSVIDTLNVTDSEVAGQYVSKVSQTNGKIIVERADFTPSITIGAGSATNAPTINVTVNSKSGIAQSLTKASTSVFGVTKLTDNYSATDSTMSLTGKALASALIEDNIPNLTLSKITDAGTMASEDKDDYIAHSTIFTYPDVLDKDEILDEQTKTVQWLFEKVKSLEERIVILEGSN